MNSGPGGRRFKSSLPDQFFSRSSRSGPHAADRGRAAAPFPQAGGSDMAAAAAEKQHRDSGPLFKFSSLAIDNGPRRGQTSAPHDLSAASATALGMIAKFLRISGRLASLKWLPLASFSYSRAETTLSSTQAGECSQDEFRPPHTTRLSQLTTTLQLSTPPS